MSYTITAISVPLKIIGGFLKELAKIKKTNIQYKKNVKKPLKEKINRSPVQLYLLSPDTLPKNKRILTDRAIKAAPAKKAERFPKTQAENVPITIKQNDG